MTEQTLNMSAHYRVDGWGAGIAFYLRGYVEEMREVEWTETDPETGETLYLYDVEPDVDTTRVRAVMVGDDREHVIDIADLHVIPEDGFCRGCGQIGCGCEVWS